jgi:signal peptidase I
MGRLLILTLAAVGGLIVVAVLAFALVGSTYRAPSESMAPTLGVGSRFTVLEFGDPEVGDVVVVNPPLGAESGEEMCGGGTPAAGQMCARPTAKKADAKFVQRVVAVGGDRHLDARRQGRAQRQARDHEGP